MEKFGLLQDKKIPLNVLLKRTLKYVRPYRKSFIIGFILIILNVILNMISPLFVGQATETLSTSNPVLDIIIWSAVGMVLITIANQFLLYLETIVLTKTGQRIVYDLRMEVFSHIESMSQNQFNEMPVGSLVTRVCNYTSALTQFFTNTLVSIFKDILTVISVYVIMMVILWKLGLVIFANVIIVFFISFFFSKYVHKYFKDERHQLSDLNTYLNESLSGMSVIQIFNQQKKCDNRFIEKNERYRKTRYKVVASFAIYRPLISFIYIGSVALTIYLGVCWQLLPGSLVSFYLYLNRFFSPIQELADKLNHITRASTAAERLFNLLDIKPEVMNKEGAKEMPFFEGKIEFKHVWFAYEGENWILKDVSFVANPKETVAFVGATGAGKTTILGLVVRNFEIQKGQI